jgi:DNA-binding IclR family transcriptional regulator
MLKLIKKATRVLDAFSATTPQWSLSDLSRHVGMPKGTVHHILASFKESGWIIQDPETRDYQLGIRLWEMGWTAVRRIGLRDIPRTHLLRLAQQTNETVHLSTIEPSEPEFAVYIDKVDSSRPVRAYTVIGGRAPSYCVASGKVILAYNPDMLAALLKRRLPRYTDKSIIDPKELQREMRITQKRGYSINRGEYREEVVGLAAPISNAKGEVFAAVGISGPAYRLPRKVLLQSAPMVIETARTISDLLSQFETGNADRPVRRSAVTAVFAHH